MYVLCANCLTNTSDDLSNRTIYFLTLFNHTLTCFENNLQGNSHSLLPLRNNSVCKNCLETYKSLSNLYNEMQKMNEREKKAEFGTHLCIDVEDAMNITRKLWSRTFNCSALCHDTVPVIAVSVFILFLPVVFYLSSYLHSEQKKRKLILPKRLKSSTSFASIQENSNWILQNWKWNSIYEWWKTQLSPKENKLIIWHIKFLKCMNFGFVF